ncbi:Cell death activator CIDE-3 [Apis cerana cerana]|uniref:Cell death activator CIDE-3 n=1 Tax=Apis cerana cerana TaxID=94128 RepID=A0A2A3EEM8_APICC|nr:Cell death activator CIDE-3 [Apis cerana cerana]
MVKHLGTSVFNTVSKEKLGVPQSENVSVVLESDGTQVEDGEYFKTLANNTILLLLRHGERWCPTGVDIIRAAISAIPKIVCETIHALELHDETPSWKIMDNKGRVTVVLHWDQRSSTSQAQQQQKGQDVQTSKYSPTKKTDLSQRPPLVIQTSLDKLNYGGKLGHLAAEVGPSRYTSPHITVINHDDMYQQQQQQQPPHHHPPQQQQTQTQTPSPQPPSSLSDGTRRTGLSKGHEHDSSESETENTIMEDEIVTSEKFLLLIDQLTRLSSKILDAIIRGDVLRELGEESEENNEDNEEEEEDRL